MVGGIESQPGADGVALALKEFAARRAVIVARSELLRAEIDLWIDRSSGSYCATDLGDFAALLTERRNSLDELMALDEEFIQYLVEHRNIG